MTQNFIFKTIKIVLIDFALELVYFPAWWYSRGVLNLLIFIKNNIFSSYKDLAIGILFKSMFKPMYGDYSIEGRIISFIMRIFILIFKLIQFLVWDIILLAILILWLGLPALAIYQIINYGK